MIDISDRADGCLLPVWAQPNARKTQILGEQDGALKVAVTAPPADGKANSALLEALRQWFGLKRSQLELVSGSTSRRKTFLVRDLPRRELVARLDLLLASSR